jgi:polysaccharide biosynthesis transport protein
VNGIKAFLGGLEGMVGMRDAAAPSGAPHLTAAQQRREQTVRSVMGALDVQILGRSTIIQITARSRSAFKAARIANALANIYVENLGNAKAASSEKAAKWLADRVNQLSRQASAADAAVQAYKAKNGLIDTSAGTALTDQRLGNLTTQLIAAEGDRAEAEAKLARMKQLIGSGKNADVTEVVDSPLIGQLREQEATLLQQKADLSSRYGDLNPKMASIDTQLAVLKQKIDEEANRIVGTISNSVAVAEARTQSLKSDMAAATSSTNAQNSARVQLGDLQATANSAHALYQTYLDRLKQTQQQSGLVFPDAHLASQASVPLSPTSPKFLLIAGGALAGGLALGFLLAMMLDQLRDGFYTMQDLERTAGLSVFATIPELVSRKSLPKVSQEVVDKPHSEFSQAIRAIEVSLSRRQGGGAGGKVFVVVSALPGEGKTTTALNLARRFTASGKKVIVVDGDFRRASASAALGAHATGPDLADYLSRRCTLDQVFVEDRRSSLRVLPVPHRREGAGEINPSAMGAVIEKLRTMTDVVIIDTPPILAMQDARLLGEVSDGALLVVRWGSTSREAVFRAVKLLRDFEIHVLGAALARAHAAHHRYYTYGYAGVPALAQYYEN